MFNVDFDSKRHIAYMKLEPLTKTFIQESKNFPNVEVVFDTDKQGNLVGVELLMRD